MANCEKPDKLTIVSYLSQFHDIFKKQRPPSGKIEITHFFTSHFIQGSQRFEKYFNLEGFLEKSLKTKFSLKSTGKSLKGLEKSLNSSSFCRT